MLQTPCSLQYNTHVAWRTANTKQAIILPKLLVKGRLVEQYLHDLEEVMGVPHRPTVSIAQKHPNFNYYRILVGEIYKSIEYVQLYFSN